MDAKKKLEITITGLLLVIQKADNIEDALFAAEALVKILKTLIEVKSEEEINFN